MNSEINPKQKWCVIVPTYNNARTLVQVLQGLMVYTSDIIVINDGSTDATPQLLGEFSSLTVLHHAKNQGKGTALQTGFKKAKELGFEFAITIDSDGQHFPEDLPIFIQRLEESDGNILLIGARNMSQAGVPKKSSFGNRFSNFWFWFETGISLSDTQSGYRLYPLNRLPKCYFTPKFEFEIESIVRAAWNGVQVVNVPIQVHYDLKDRVSHFRPFQDFTRISILNTVLVLISLIYIKPRDFFRRLKKKGLLSVVKEELFASHESNFKKAASIALGVFWGIIPLWGFQTAGVIGSAYVLRLNKLIAFTFSNVSLPPFIPIIVFGSFKFGALFVEHPVHFLPQSKIDMDFVKLHLKQYVIGSSLLAIIAAIVVGGVSWGILQQLRKQN